MFTNRKGSVLPARRAVDENNSDLMRLKSYGKGRAVHKLCCLAPVAGINIRTPLFPQLDTLPPSHKPYRI